VPSIVRALAGRHVRFPESASGCDDQAYREMPVVAREVILFHRAALERRSSARSGLADRLGYLQNQSMRERRLSAG
jgi:hypothetical protein